jgi:hypothetical protein
MTGKERRIKMDEAIKDLVIPFLRELGFKGSYPHFRREKENKLNLLAFQFSLSGPKFVVEISNCPINGFNPGYGNDLKPAECRVYYMNKRLRIGSIKNGAGYWYDFSKEPLFGDIYKKRANELIANWDEAENWWIKNPFDDAVGAE